MNNLGVNHKDFWSMPFFMLVDLLKQASTVKEPMTRKQVLTSMKYNREVRGWI